MPLAFGREGAAGGTEQARRPPAFVFLTMYADFTFLKLIYMKKSFKFLAVAALAVALVCSCAKGPKNVTLDFEGDTWTALIDNPQYGGPKTYGTYDESTWTWSGAEGYSWSDGNSMLEFPGFPDSWGSRCFSSGGEVISNYVDANYEGKGYLNQLEVPVAPASGKNFVVHYGSNDPTVKPKSLGAPIYPMIKFSDNQPRVIKSIDVCLTNYLINSCLNGDGMFGPISGDTAIYVKAVGFDATGAATLAATATLIKGADVEAYKAGTKKFAWVKWDLSELGEVCGLIFAVTGTSDCYGDYGFNAPAYFAYDNVVVEMPAEK